MAIAIVGIAAAAHGALASRVWRRAAAIDVAEMLEGIARDVRSGSALPAAISAARRSGAGADVLGEAVRRMRAGDTLSRALTPDASPLGDSARLALTTLAACATAGGPMSDTIERAASTLREHAALDAERRAQASQARASMWVLTLVPLVFAVWNAAVDADVRAFLLGSSAGWICLVGGLALSAAGWWWMRAIVDGSSA